MRAQSVDFDRIAVGHGRMGCVGARRCTGVDDGVVGGVSRGVERPSWW